MKIAIEAQRIFRKKKHGIDLVAIELIRKLQQIDHENEYYILVRKDVDNKVLHNTQNFHIMELPAVPYPVWEQYYLPRAIKKIKPDILHCTGNTAPLNVQVPLVLTLHDILYLQKINLTKGSTYQRFGNLYRRWIVPKIIHKCRNILTVSDFERNEIEQHFGFPEGRVKTVYNAFSSHFGKRPGDNILKQFKEKFRLPDQYILFLGNTHPNKNMQTVLSALLILQRNKQLPIPLVMPDIEEAFLQDVLEKMNITELRERIILTGYVPNHELAYIYTMATLFLYPSFYESFGIPILEAMSSGVPVITSDRAAMPEIAGGAAVLTDPEKEEDLALAILRLLQDKKLYVHCKDAGLKRASSFNWAQTAFETLNIYYDAFGQTSEVPSKSLMV